MSPPRSTAWHRVSSLRRVHKIEGYRSAGNTGGEWLTMSEAATKFGVTNHKIRRVVEGGLLPTEQIMPGAPHQIRAADLEKPAVRAAISRKRPVSRHRPRTEIPVFRHLKRSSIMNQAL
ncbi:hypothetical protein [Mesorhizobium sp. M0085]|uniref:hypothetical protein n=1 Tax=Mesorhizobium sp. M0085 TaxID=2956872 RepID=UPI00333AE3F6